MASIENRSKVQVSVKNRDDLTKTFEYCAEKAIKAYVERLKAQGYKPRLESLNNYYCVRARQVGYPTLTLYETKRKSRRWTSNTKSKLSAVAALSLTTTLHDEQRSPIS